MEQQNGLRVAVIGSRGIEKADLAKYIPENASVILSGGAKGIDTLAEQYARERGIPTEILLPNYALFGKSAPLIRDRQIVDRADLVVAIWDGKSPGTRYTIEYAKSQSVPVRLFIPVLRDESSSKE